MARAVFDGRVTRGSRAELRATLDPLADGVAESSAQLTAVPAPLSPGQVRDLMAAGRADEDPGRPPVWPTEVLVPLALALRDPAARDQAWSGFSRGTAPHWVATWSDAVRRLPDELVAGPAAVLAVAAWLAGEGALAWCAVERCRAVEPDHSLARLVADLLDEACSPDLWDQLRSGPDLGAA
jgi:hypothetical protein